MLVASSPSPAFSIPVEDARHLLSRVGFGPTPAEIEQLTPLDRGAAIKKLLERAGTTAVTPPPAWVEQPRLRPTQKMAPKERRALRKRRKKRGLALKAWWLQEMIATPTPVTEVMTLFWHSHLPSSLKKVRSPGLLYRQNVLLRTHALGSYRTMLKAIARDPAMLVYLDGARSKRGAPNENFARELMELFTVGEGAYTEADVKEAARAFTGWSIKRKTGAFRLRKRWIDRGIKQIRGRSANWDGDMVIDMLLDDPRTARRIVEKLWRVFIDDTPEGALVEAIAARFQADNYAIKPTLQALLETEAFWKARGRLIKSPVDLLVGTIRQLPVEVTQPVNLARLARRLGQDVFDPPNVKGWPGGKAWITGSSWIERQSVLRRMFQPNRRRKKRQLGDMPDLDAWLKARPKGWTSAQSVVQQLLPRAPYDAPVLDKIPSAAMVRRLLLDPVYQLK